MPAKSQAQRGWAFGVMGEAWARKHGYDNAGPLPEHVKSRVKKALKKMLPREERGESKRDSERQGG